MTVEKRKQESGEASASGPPGRERLGEPFIDELCRQDALTLVKQQAVCKEELDDGFALTGEKAAVFADLKPNDYPAFGFDLFPRKFSLKDGVLHIEDDLSRLVKATPDFTVPEILQDLARATRSLQIKPGSPERTVTVNTQGQHEFELDLSGYGKLKVKMKDPLFRVRFSDKDANKLEIVEIQGAQTNLGDLTGMTMRLTENAEGKPVLRMQVTHRAKVEEKPKVEPKRQWGPLDYGKAGLDRLTQLKASAERGLSNMLSFDMPLDDDSAKAARDILAYGRRWSQLKDFSEVFEILGDQSQLPVVKDILKDVTGITRSGDNGEKLEIFRKGEKTIEGPLSLKLEEKIALKLSKVMKGEGVEGTSIKLSEITGISAKLPLPEQVLKQLGIPATVELSELELSDKGKDGSRRLTLRSKEHGSISVDLGEDGKLLLRDGNLTVAVTAVMHGKELPCTVTFNPEKTARTGLEGPDFTIAFKGSDEQLIEVLQKTVGGSPGPLEQLGRGLKEVKKEGGRFILVREKATTSEVGGMVVQADQTVEFALEQKNGVQLEDIKGLSYKFKIDLGWLHDALDLPRETASTSVSSIHVGNADASGKFKVVVKGDGPFAAVAVEVKDGKIATDPGDDNRGSIHAMIRQKPTAEDIKAGKPAAYIAVVLKVDADGNNKMTKGEMTKAAAEAVYMTINKDKFRGFEPLRVNGKELFTEASGDRQKAPVCHIDGYDLKVRMELPYYRGGKGVVIYHNGSNLRAVAANGDEWELRQRGGYKQSRDKHDLDKTFWVKVEGDDLNWPCHGERDKAPIITIPGPEIDVRMCLPYYSGAGTVRIAISDRGHIHCFGPQGSEWELRHVGKYDQKRDARNPDKTVWVRIK